MRRKRRLCLSQRYKMAFCGARFLGTANILADRPGRCGRGATLAANRTQPRIRAHPLGIMLKFRLCDPSAGARTYAGSASWCASGQARLAREGGARSPPGGRAIACEQAVPQTEAAKRHYAGGSCRGGFQTRPRSAFTVCEVDPSLAVRTSIQQLMTAILSQRACGTRAGLKPAPTSFATAMCFPSGVCGTLVICDRPAPGGGLLPQTGSAA